MLCPGMLCLLCAVQKESLTLHSDTKMHGATIKKKRMYYLLGRSVSQWISYLVVFPDRKYAAGWLVCTAHCRCSCSAVR
jgi:hypothetical protein